MKKYIITSMVGLLALTSCRLDDNITTNQPLTTSVSLKQRLSAAQTSSYAVQAGRMNALGNIWMNAWSGNIYQYGNPATDETDLTLSTGFYAGIWSDMYRAITRYQVMIQSDQAATYPNHVAIAKIMKAYNMQYIVDLYGDAPYSEAFQEVKNVTPKYDDDVEIYKALAQELYESRTLITGATGVDAFKVKTEDVMFGGDMIKWNKMANTVLLKIAVRLSNTTDTKGIALRNDIISKLAGATYITEDVKINPGYNNSSASSQNPIYNWFGRYTAAGTSNTGGYFLYRASDHIIKTLEGDASKITSGVSDPRIAFLFSKATEYCTGTSKYVGLIQGADKTVTPQCPGTTAKPTNSSFSGFGGLLIKDTTTGSSADGFVMMLAESEFLQAEAAVYYPGSFSGAQVHFENGVKASFAFDGLAGSSAAYLTAIAGKTLVGWGTDNNTKIAAIQYQRYVALTNYNALETFINFRKTGYPATPLSTSTSKTSKPYRLVYPNSEYSANAANVPMMTSQDPFSLNTFTPFWYK